VRDAAPGVIYVGDVDEVGVDGIRELFAGDRIGNLGAMGTRAKQRVSDEGIAADFTYGVIDKCILKALRGEHSAVLTSGGMVDHVCRRIEEYGRESGKAITVIPIGRTRRP
jgi:cobalt/nickel transport system ATP-binding protein